MVLSRRFKNLIVDSSYSGAKWLRCVDLTQLFNDTPPSTTTIGDSSKSLPPAPCLPSCNQAEATAVAKTKEIQMSNPNQAVATTAAKTTEEFLQMSDPIFKFEQHDPHDIHCFPLSNGRVVICDSSGRTMFCDPYAGNLVTMPSLYKPKHKPISLFVPSDAPADADADDHHSSTSAGSLYIMENVPEPEKIGSMKPSDQFEALVYRKPPSRSYGNPWQCQAILPPPFVREDIFNRPKKNIITYGVVGSSIFISTLCNDSCLLDTASNTWTRVDNLAVQFFGKMEYVPELNLWFGLTAEEGYLSAATADGVATMDESQPELVGDWKDFDPPAGWQEYDFPQLVSLGSGKFCIAKFFQARSIGGGIDRIAVFTGVEVMQVVQDDGNCNGSPNNGKVTKLRMEKHRSRFHVSNGTTVTAVF